MFIMIFQQIRSCQRSEKKYVKNLKEVSGTTERRKTQTTIGRPKPFFYL